MKKKSYSIPFFTIIALDSQDVITASDFVDVERVDEVGFQYIWE